MKKFAARKNGMAVEFEAPDRLRAEDLLREHNMADYEIFWESPEDDSIEITKQNDN